MKVFERLMIIPFIGNLFNPINALSGSPARVAIKIAEPETLRDKKIMLNNSGSILNIRENAFLKASIIESIAIRLSVIGYRR